MVIIEKTAVEHIPLLHLVESGQSNQRLPFIVFIHGFTSAKEHNLHYAYLLAEKGFRVVLPEALYHGERNVDLSQNDLNIHFWEIVIKTITEMNIVKDYFENSHLINDQIGVVGTSMGGIVTLGALTQYDWIKAAVSLMGLPNYEKFARLQLELLNKHGVNYPLNNEDAEHIIGKLRVYDLSLQPEKLKKRPLLFWHGKKDDVVPFAYTYEFYQSIRHYYEKTPANLQFITDEKAGHKVSHDGVLKTVEWFERYLK